jgi:hypothetical protein
VVLPIVATVVRRDIGSPSKDERRAFLRTGREATERQQCGTTEGHAPHGTDRPHPPQSRFPVRLDHLIPRKVDPAPLGFDLFLLLDEELSSDVAVSLRRRHPKLVIHGVVEWERVKFLGQDNSVSLEEAWFRS